MLFGCKSEYDFFFPEATNNGSASYFSGCMHCTTHDYILVKFYYLKNWCLQLVDEYNINVD